jgi:LCP family protein required for cell wall assembly
VKKQDSQPQENPQNRVVKKKRKNKKRWRIAVISAGLLAVIVGSAAGIEYARLDPIMHFSHLLNFSNGQSSVTLHNGEFNLLLLGVDSRTPNTPARSDSIMLVHVNLVKHEYDILSIPRDSRVEIPPYGMTKITHANYLGDIKNGTPLGGIKLASQIVSNFTQLPINFYAEINHFGLQSLVDSIGTVRVYVPFNVPIINAWYPDLNGKTIPAGYDTLNGEMASELVHQRELLPQGDFSRQQLQEELLLAIAQKLRQPQNWPMIPGFLQSLPKFLTTTNMSTEDMLSLIVDLHNFKKSDIHYYQVPGSSGQYMDPVLNQVLDYWVPNMPAVQKIIQAHFKS